MKRVFRSLLVLLLLASFLTSAAPVTTSAAGGDAQRWNIMLVVDASGSLFSVKHPADKAGLRFDAIGSFLGVLQDDGHHVGAIAFHAAAPNQETQEGAILANTGLLSFDDMGAAAAKDEILATLENNLSRKSGNSTDIGSAMLTAVEELESADNDLPCAIFLFTDGASAVESVHQAQSNANRDEALRRIQASNGNIKLCGVYLNALQDTGYRADATDVRDLVREAYGIHDSSANLDNYYVELTDSAGISEATDTFMRMLGYSVPVPDPSSLFNKDHELSRTFRIPGVGVEEVNIRFNSVGGKQLPDMDIEITAPSGGRISAADPNVEFTSGKTYQVWKIRAPESGTWNVQARVRDNSTVSVTYTPIFSFYVQAQLETELADDVHHLNQDVRLTASLTQNGTKLTDPSAYREYKCFLTFTNTATQEVKEVEINPNGGSYVYDLYLDQSFLPHGYYDVQVRYDCDSLTVASAPEAWDLNNNAPVCQKEAEDLTIQYGLFKPAEFELDLEEFFYDLEDQTSLTLEILDTDCDEDGLELEDGSLIITGKVAGSGEIKLQAVDSLGLASPAAVIHVTAKDVTVPTIITIAVIVLVLIVIAIITALLISRYINSNKATGDCQLIVDLDSVQVNMYMTPPGVEGKRSTNLAAMVRRAIEKGRSSDYSDLAEECRSAGITIDELEQSLSPDMGELKKVSVSVKLKKAGKKGKVAKVAVSYQKTNTVLLGKAVSLMIGGRPYEFGYYPPQSGDDFDIDSTYMNMGADNRDEAFMDDIFSGSEAYMPTPKAPGKKGGAKKTKKAPAQADDLFGDSTDY